MNEEATYPTTEAAAQTGAHPETHPPQPAWSGRQAPTTLADDPLRRSPVLAAILAMMPGLGQVYTGYTRLGFIHAIVVATIIAFLASSSSESLIPLAAIFLGFFWLYGIVDAARRAVLVNQALLGRLNLDLPETPGDPGLRGSIPGGVAVIAMGVLLLSNTLFDLSLRWVEDWWPVVVIGFGAFLVFRAIQDRQAGQGRSGSLDGSAAEPPTDEL